MIDKSLNYGREHIKDFLERIAPFASVLDLGAGDGGDLMIARSVAPGARLYALEYWPPNVEELKKKGVEVFTFNIEHDRFPFPDESLDAIIINQVLEHVKELFWILHEVARVLRPGGHFIIGVPNLASFHNRVLLTFGRQPSCIRNASAHLRGYTKRDMISLLSLNGELDIWRLRSFRGSNFYPFPPVLARPLSRLAPSMSVSVFFDFEKTAPYRREYLDYPTAKGLETNFYVGPVSP